MSREYEEKVRLLSPAKALAIGVYGESVASFRYRTLAEKTSHESHRGVFMEMAEEEHGHHDTLQALLKSHFPDADFVLTPHDKEMVIVGPRMPDVTDQASVDRALDMIYDSELLTGKFYATLCEIFPVVELRPMLREMADECFQHAEQLRALRSGS